MAGQRDDTWSRMFFGTFLVGMSVLVLWQSIGKVGFDGVFGCVLGFLGVAGGLWIMFADHTERWTRDE
jgi:hypothetical protein